MAGDVRATQPTRASCATTRSAVARSGETQKTMSMPFAFVQMTATLFGLLVMVVMIAAATRAVQAKNRSGRAPHRFRLGQAMGLCADASGDLVAGADAAREASPPAPVGTADEQRLSFVTRQASKIANRPCESAVDACRL